jgi:U3 small nucleolar ribonucleoprotein component
MSGKGFFSSIEKRGSNEKKKLFLGSYVLRKRAKKGCYGFGGRSQKRGVVMTSSAWNWLVLKRGEARKISTNTTARSL